MSAAALPLTLYVHMPWCVRKCPYCDFNSHQLKSTAPSKDYIGALIRDFESELVDLGGRSIDSIFFGGGTPSLFAPDDFARLLDAFAARGSLAADVEVTLEANPGTIERGRFSGYRDAGINRVSLGCTDVRAAGARAPRAHPQSRGHYSSRRGAARGGLGELQSRSHVRAARAATRRGARGRASRLRARASPHLALPAHARAGHGVSQPASGVAGRGRSLSACRASARRCSPTAVSSNTRFPPMRGQARVAGIISTTGASETTSASAPEPTGKSPRACPTA